MKTEAGTGEMRPQAQGHLEPPEAGKGRKDPPLELLDGAQLWDILISDVWSPGLGLQVSAVLSLCLWSFVM